MAIEDHALRPELVLIDLGSIPYTNPRLAGLVSNVQEYLDYVTNVLYPNYVATVPTVGDLPGTANDGDYYIVTSGDNGNQEGWIWETRDGASGFHKKFDVDWSVEGILSDLQNQIDPEYVTLLGKQNGQRIAGGSTVNTNLELEGNSFDDSGLIIIHNDLVPESDQGESLGSNSLAFLHAHIKGALKDGTNEVTVAQCLTAYLHSQITDANPHQTTYEQILNRLTTVTLDGDINTIVLDLSTAGAKAATVVVKDDSHDHTKATLPNFDDDVWEKVKLILQDTFNVTYTKNDGTQEITAAVTVTTSNITDVESPAANKILVANTAGDGWIQSDGTIELTGDTSGVGSYNSIDDKVEIAVTVDNVDIRNIDRIKLDNLQASCDASATVQITTALEHKFVSGNKVRLHGSSFDAEYVVTVVDDFNFTIPYDNSAGSVENFYYIPDLAQLLYNSVEDVFEVRREFAGLSHFELEPASLNNSDDHNLLYVKLGGRSDGSLNVITGAELANGNLFMQSTSDRANPGRILIRDKVAPEIGSVYTTEWVGTDLGESGRAFRDIYMRGELKGGRIEQVSSLPIATVQDRGRVVQTPDGKYYINKLGTQYKQLMEMPDLVGRSGLALVVNDTEDGFNFTEVEVISSNSIAGELTGIGASSVETISAPIGAIGIYIQVDEANASTLRMAWGTSDPTTVSGVELLQGEREYFRISTDLKVIAESGTSNKLSYTWAVK